VLCATLAFVYFSGVLPFIPMNYIRVAMRGFVYLEIVKFVICVYYLAIQRLWNVLSCWREKT